MSERTKNIEPVNLKELEKKLEEIEGDEQKLELLIEFMQSALAQAGTPHFKDFWLAKKKCSDLFKGNISPAQRMALWTKYTEMSNEARRLKEIFDNESAFAIEQIEMAVESLEADIERLEQLKSLFPSFYFEQSCSFFEPSREDMARLQRDAAFFNSYGTKVNALRRELIKTEMRVRDKNKFFERLSKIGDAIFPTRKTLIGDISTRFKELVEAFIGQVFSKEQSLQSLFHFKDEIKALQHIAKELTLNNEAFSTTRKELSQCWDTLSKSIETRKKEDMDQREEFKEKKEEIEKEIAALQQQFEENAIDLSKILEAFHQLERGISKAGLRRNEVFRLKDKIHDAKKPYLFKQKEEDDKKKEELRRKEKERQEKIEAFKEKIQEVGDGSKKQSSQDLQSQYEHLSNELLEFKLNRAEKIDVERALRVIKDIIAEKREDEILNLSSDDQEKFKQLQLLLKEKNSQYKEIKSEIEELRRSKGSSQFDFAAALEANDTVEELKTKLIKQEESIDEIKQQIKGLRQ